MVSHHDPVYGRTLDFQNEEEDVVNSQEFQHGRKKKQLGLVNRIYPMSQNDRFAHPLGTGYLMRLWAEQFRLPREEILLWTAVGFLHDIGHYSGSHSLEHLAKDLLGLPNHEQNGIEMILGKRSLPGKHWWPKVHDILRKHERSGISPERVAAMLKGGAGLPPFYHEAISNPAGDADRIDYLMRDGHAGGSKTGMAIEYPRITDNLVVQEGKNGIQDGHLGIRERGLESMVRVVAARRAMYETVYFHGLTIAAETMLRKAVELSIDVAKPLMWGDEVLFERLLEYGTPKSQELILRIDGGYKAFYPRAFHSDPRRLGYDPDSYSEEDRLVAEKVLRLEKNSKQIEKDLLSRTGLENGDILVAFTKPKQKPLPYFPVLLSSGRWTNLFSMPNVQTEYLAENRLSNFSVYAAPENVAKAKAAALEFLAEQP